MKISLTDAGKRFNRDWIFRHLSYTFEKGKSYAITGPNGSGKSTLLLVISGAMQLSEGGIRWSPADDRRDDRTTINNQRSTTIDHVCHHVSICAPYLEVVEEMTLKEFLHFHQQFKSLLPGVDIEKIISIINLDNAVNKQIRYFSSGMKQRVKLAQAVFSNVPVVLLDEPCTNLDTAGIEIYHRLISDFCKDRLVIVSSNDEVEYGFCEEKINITDYK